MLQPTNMKHLFVSVFLMLVSVAGIAEKGKKEKQAADTKADSLATAVVAYMQMLDSLEKTLKYEDGKVTLQDGDIVLDVPKSFKFLGAAQAKYVISEIWGNPPQDDVLGMLLPAQYSPLDDSAFAFIISFDAMGYVKDDDAADIDYDDLMKDWQTAEVDENKERVAAGYEKLHLVGWAAKPFYDADKKVMHWAKEIAFGDNGEHTLNYDVRVLGRKGVLSMNAVAGMYHLKDVQQNITAILAMPEFASGNKYSDFNPDIDEVAAVTVGGLVAGKVLAKAGILALLAKGWKLIVIGAVALWAGLKKFVFGRKKEEDEFTPQTEESSNEVADAQAETASNDTVAGDATEGEENTEKKDETQS